MRAAGARSTPGRAARSCWRRWRWPAVGADRTREIGLADQEASLRPGRDRRGARRDSATRRAPRRSSRTLTKAATRTTTPRRSRCTPPARMAASRRVIVEFTSLPQPRRRHGDRACSCPAADAVTEIRLSDGARARGSARMFDCFATPARRCCDNFAIDVERFRPAPRVRLHRAAARRDAVLRAVRLGHDRRALPRAGRRGRWRNSQREARVKLSVLSVAYPLAPVGPDAAGGSEQILDAARPRAGARRDIARW